MLQHDVGRVVGADFGEELRRAAAGRNQFDQRRLVAHADAADPFHHGRRAAFGQRVFDRAMDLAASLGDAARAEPDADFAHVAAEDDRPRRAVRPRRSFCCCRKSSSTSPTIVGREPAVGDAVDLHDRGQRAAAEAGHLLDREQPVGVGVVAVGDLQPPLEGVLDQLGALHVAGRAVADVDDVSADRAMAELGVEGRHAHDRRRRDVGQLADPLDRLARHVAIVRLNRLEDRDHGIAAAAEPLDALDRRR